MPVLVVVTNADEVEPLMRWGARFARARTMSLSVLYVGRAVSAQGVAVLEDDPADLHPVRKAMRETKEDLSALFNEAKFDGEDESKSNLIPRVTLRAVGHPDPFQAVMASVAELDIDLLVVGRYEKLAGEEGHTHLSVRLLEAAPCDTMLLRAGEASGQKCGRILTPAAGGPHSVVSLQLSEAMARDDDGVVTPLYVEPQAAEALEVGERQLAKAMHQAGVRESEFVVPAVVLADSPVRGIAKCAADGEYDLVLVGASNEGFVTRVLFGSIPDRLLAGPDAIAAAVVRRARPMGSRALEAVGDAVARWIPQLDREARISLFEKLQTGSKFGVDFFVLISLSTAIACLGLLLNSAAVVIGAMLVAPLMTPMIGAGLGLVQGNVVLVRDASKSILLGFLTAMAIGYLLGLAFGGMAIPGRGLNAQLIARGAPNALDLLVAFLSGLAAAYALARPNLSGALAGVAIAAALVPPIGTVGISIAQGAYANGRGAAFLFGTNLLAIVLGAATCFYAIGVEAGGVHGRGRLWARRVLVVLVLTVVMIAFPLGSRLLGIATREEPSRAVVPVRVHIAIEHAIKGLPGIALVAVEPLAGEGLHLEVVVAAVSQPQASLATDLAEIAARELGAPVTVQVVGLRTEWFSEGASSALGP